MKKILASILIIATMLTLFALTVSASFGNGVTAVANEVSIVKSGLYGRKLTFSDLDFKQGLCITDFKRVTITKLPDSSAGVLMLAGRRATEGVSIKRKNLPSLVFIPASKDVSEAEFNAAKRSLENSYKQIFDNPLDLQSFYATRRMFGIYDTVEDTLKKLFKVTLSDVIDIAKEVHLDTVFFVEGTATKDYSEEYDDE